MIIQLDKNNDTIILSMLHYTVFCLYVWRFSCFRGDTTHTCMHAYMCRLMHIIIMATAPFPNGNNIPTTHWPVLRSQAGSIISTSLRHVEGDKFDTGIILSGCTYIYCMGSPLSDWRDTASCIAVHGCHGTELPTS